MTTKWITKKLGEVCITGSGGTPLKSHKEYYENGSIPWVLSGEVSQGEINGAKHFITEAGLKNSSAKIFPKDTVLIAMYGATVGQVGILKFPATTNQAICGILPNEILLPKYIYYFFLSIKDDLLMQAVGGAQPNISQLKIKEQQIHILPIEKQEQIVKILDRAESLRKKRKQSISLFNQYLRSVFLEMFGDPINNPKKWNLKKFATIGTLDRGISKHRPRNAPDLLGGSHPLIQTGDVANSRIYIDTFRSTYSDVGLKQSKKWPKGTLCITIAANIAKTGILNFDACFPDSVVGFVADRNQTNNEFIHFWISFLQEMLENNAYESAQKNINLKILRNLDVITPPIHLQNKFLLMVHKAELVQEKMTKQANDFDMQFKSMMQKSFMHAN